jgi:DNA end-binding protein Ku
MPPRALWTGSISFGLVNVPVRLYSAVQEHDLHFNFVHEPDGSRIGYEKICKAEGKPVPDDEIVKAFEWEKGEWVYLTDEDFAAAEVEGHRTIEISDFVPSDEIDPIFFEKTFYLGPQEGGEHVYALLAKALDQSGLAGVAKFVMRDRQHLGVLRIRDGVIMLERLYFADEIRDPEEYKPSGVRVEKRELDMATELIDRFSGKWDPKKYKDTYRDALMAIIKKKRKGEEVHVEREPEPEEPTDLMEALRASLESAQRSTPSARKRSTAGRKRGPDRKSRTRTKR